jgi:hypothetical protein
VQGELSGTWGNTVNTSITQLLDSAVAGTTTLSTDADVTLTTTSGATNTARQAILLCTGARTSIKTITAPAQSKAYIVINNTTGGYAVKVVGTGPTTGVTIPNGAEAVVAWNGSDFVVVSSGVYDPANVAITGGTMSGVTITGAPSIQTVSLTATGSTTLGDSGSADVHAINGAVSLAANSSNPALLITNTGTNAALQITGSNTSGTSYGLVNNSSFGTGVGTAKIFDSQPSLSASVANLTHFNAQLSSGGVALSNETGFAFNESAGVAAVAGVYLNVTAGANKYGVRSLGTAANYFGGETSITSASTGATLKITNTGTGNSLLVEDSASTDSTPFVIDASGRVIVGTDQAAITYGQSITPSLQVNSTTSAAFMGVSRWTSGAGAGGVSLAKSRGASVNTRSVVLADDDLGSIIFDGDDGSNFVSAAQITGEVDVSPTASSGIIGGRLSFRTAPSGSVSTPTERMRIDSSGNVGIGSSTTGAERLRLAGTYTASGGFTFAARSVGTIDPTAATTAAYQFYSDPSISAGTLAGLSHYHAAQGTYTGAVTTQYGFHASSTLTGATNNYGFYGNIASGTGRWNFYAGGTAANYFGGETTIASASTGDTLRITNTGTGNSLVVEDSANPDATPFVVDPSGAVISGYTATVTTVSYSGGGATPALQKHGTNLSGASYGSYIWSASSSGSQFTFNKSRGASANTSGLVSNGDELGAIVFAGDDGSGVTVPAFKLGATIIASVSGVAAAGDMPTRLSFNTTPAASVTPVERFRIAADGLVSLQGTSGLSIVRTAVTAPAAGDGNVFSGTYTPSLTIVTNLDSATPAACHYMRVGDTVTVSGSFTADPTAAGNTEFGMSLPIASNFSSLGQCGGTAVATAFVSDNPVSINGDTVNDRAQVRWVTTRTASTVYTFTFSYRVI